MKVVGLLGTWLKVLLAGLNPRVIRTWEDEARLRGLVPVFCDWRSYFAVDGEGRPVCAPGGEWRHLQEETDPRMRHLVLAQAAIRYPHLERLRPVRQPGDPVCERCGGAGTLAGSRRICWCGGTGWLPSGVDQEFEASSNDA